ncbi:MAG: carboxypeptidase regulatory-like domain-containing protein [Planctomycetes bacterium]|nr:carboxypeptidase regulatory-like domain-containing protein [Planctomycetota bacterium]MBL7043050.1 carboxypeptidase regulatory-like domain-containing protein [Pirellulaceae bacterium]
MALRNRVGNIPGSSPLTVPIRWWRADLLALAVPLAIWLTGVIGHRAGAQVDGSLQDTRTEGLAEQVTLNLEIASKSESTLPAQRTIPFELDKEFPLGITSDAGDDRAPVHLASIIIRREDDELRADVKASFFSYPKSKWGVAIEKISEDGEVRPIYWADHVFENSGRIISQASRETAELHVPLGLAKNLADASELRVSIRPISGIDGTRTIRLELGAMLPLEIESGACGRAGGTSLAWVMLRNEKAQLTATARLLLLSAPKGKWRVTTELLSEDDKAEPLAVDRAVFENSGMVRGQPLLGNRDLRFSLGTTDRLDQATRLRVTIEQVPSGTETTRHMREPEELPYAFRVRRATTDRFLQALFAKQDTWKVSKVTGISRPKTYMDIAKGISPRAGQFERALSYRMCQAEGGQYLEARCQWEKAVMLVRLTFDEEGEQVTGFWLARDKEGATPQGFKRGGYIIGRSMMEVAGLDKTAFSNIHNLSAHVALVDKNGRPKDPPSKTMLWKRTLDPNAHAYSSADLIEDMDGVKWQYVSETRSTDHTFSDLSAGVYRLTANYLGTRTIVSDAFSVTGSPAQADIPFAIPDSQRAACRISARLIDEESNEPLEPFQPLFKLYRSGFPRVSYRYDNKYDKATPEEGYACDLLPGVYQVDVYGAWHSIGGRSRALARPMRFSLEVTERGPNEFTFDISSHTFAEADAEVATRWPNIVEGSVRTADGAPVESADVHLHGRPEERAWTTTDADGRYSLRFAPEIYTSATEAARLVKQDQLNVYSNAIVHVEKRGYVEAKFATHGRFTVVEEAPLDKEGNSLAPESIAVRGGPFHDINFTMVPAARIDTNFFRDQDGKPIDRQLVLMNADAPELRLYEQDSAVDHFEGVPTVGRWRFQPFHEPSGPQFDASLSPVISFSAPGSYHAYLQAVEIPEEERSHPNKTLRLKILSLIDPNGQEVAPSPEPHIMVDGKREPLPSPVRIGENSEEN